MNESVLSLVLKRSTIKIISELFQKGPSLSSVINEVLQHLDDCVIFLRFKSQIMQLSNILPFDWMIYFLEVFAPLNATVCLCHECQGLTQKPSEKIY